MAATHFYQRLTFAFYGCVLLIALTHGDKEIVLSEPREGQQWIWRSDAAWTSSGSPASYVTCTIGSPQVFNLGTPFIAVPPSVTTIEVTIEYAIKNCSDAPSGFDCSETFDLYKFEQNESQPLPSFHLFKDKVKTIRAGPGQLANGPPGDAVKRIKDVILVTVNSKGVYVAITERSVCLALFSVEFSYRVCSKSGVNHVSFETTILPGAGSLSETVNGSCVANAVPSPNASRLQAVCNSKGEWIVGPSVSCVCKVGYQPSANLQRCLEVKPSTTLLRPSASAVKPNATVVDLPGGFNTTATGVRTTVTPSRPLTTTPGVKSVVTTTKPTVTPTPSSSATTSSTAATYPRFATTIGLSITFVLTFL